MGEGSGDDRTYYLRAQLSNWFAVASSFKEGKLHRSMTMVGRIDDFHDADVFDPVGHPFHGKLIKFFLVAPMDETWVAKVREQKDVEHVCGVATVAANVQPKVYDFDGEIVHDQPVQVYLAVSIEAFDAIQHQAYDAEARRYHLEANITLSGNSLPQAGGLGIVHLKDLDVSEAREYAVRSASFMETKRQDFLRGRVINIRPSRDEPDGESLLIRISEARYRVSMERGVICDLHMEGVIDHRFSPFHGADVSIMFREFERQRIHDELPAQAFAGEYSFFPKEENIACSPAYFSLCLRFVPGDERIELLPLVRHGSGTKLILQIDLVDTRETLLATGKEKRGNVRSYSFDVFRTLDRERTPRFF